MVLKNGAEQNLGEPTAAIKTYPTSFGKQLLERTGIKKERPGSKSIKLRTMRLIYADGERPQTGMNV